MDAQALTDGQLGQSVIVKNPHNNKTFSAIVSGDKLAEIRS